MKHPYQILLLLLLFASSHLQAQPTISSSVMVGLGDSAPVQFALGNFLPGPSGPNVNWNYANLADDTLAFTWLALDPAGTAFQDSFPDANLAFQAPVQGGNSESWIYYKYDALSETLDLHGSASILYDSVGADTFYYVLTPNPKRVQTFPFTNGDSYMDAFVGRNHINFGGLSFVQNRNGNITVTGDAYGSLVTPAGTFQNVLRVYTREDITDNLMGSITTQEIHRYTWYSANEKYLLLHMDSIIVTPAFGQPNVSTSIFYRDGSPMVAVEESLKASELGLQVFPNPCTDHAKVKLAHVPAGKIRGSVLNIIGESLMEFEGLENEPLWMAELDLSTLASGTYFIQIRTSSGTATQKFTKIQ